MKTLRWTCAALVVAALSGCFFYNYDPSPAVDLEASATWIVTGEDIRLSADASDAMGDDLSYEWYEDGERIPGAGAAELGWRSWADGTRRYVSVSVTVRDSLGRSASDSIDLTVDPRADGAVLVVNDSSTDVWWFHDRPWSSTEWSPDRLGSYVIIPPGTSYVVINTDPRGYAEGWWDLYAENGPGTSSWQKNDAFLSNGRVYAFVLTD
jgi:hypothetical protein